MTEPDRLSDDDGAAPELRALLRNARKARALDPVIRERTQARVARAAALPVAAAGWLSVKTAVAAFGIGCGTAAVAVIASSPQAVPQPVAAAQTHVNTLARQASRPLPAPSPVPAAPVPPPQSANPATPSPSASAHAASSVASFPAQAASALTAESALLEQARSALRRAPAEALRLAHEHTDRFPSGQLKAERALIEVEALHRLGRDSEAEQLAQALLSRSADDLYVERVQRLLDEISGR